MITRIFSSIVGLLMLAVVLYFFNITGLTVVVYILSIIGMHEFYNAVSGKLCKPLKLIGYSCGTFIILVTYLYNDGFINDKSVLINIAGCGLFICILMSAIFVLFSNKFNVVDISVTFFGVLYVAFLFNFILLVAALNSNLSFVYMICIGAWATDTFAYFTGLAFGKTKLIESISPKKTVEGSIGGILGSILISILYGIISAKFNFLPAETQIYQLVIVGFLTGIISQLGDLFASSIKRYVGVKDYGSIMPGHGGILDRFDSILFVAPVVYFWGWFNFVK